MVFMSNLSSMVSILVTVSFRTPLMIAVANGHLDSLMVLLGLGANIQAQDIYRRTALHRAVSSNNYFCTVVGLKYRESNLMKYNK